MGGHKTYKSVLGDDEVSTTAVPSAVVSYAQATVAIAWAVGAGVCFGLTHWITGLVQQQQSTTWLGDVDTSRVIQLMCAFSGLFSNVPNLLAMLTKHRGPMLEDYERLLGLHPTKKLTFRQYALVFAIGPIHYTALSIQRVFLHGNARNAGPLLSIVSSDAVLVSLCCHFCLREKMSLVEFLLVGLTVAGNVISSWSVASEGPGQDGAHLPWTDVMWSLLAMALFATAAMAMRLSSKDGLSSLTKFVVRCLSLAVMSALEVLIVAEGEGAELGIGPTFTVLCAALSILHDLGIFCIMQALSYPLAGICTAIWGSNAVVAFLLNIIFLGALPQRLAIVGMMTTIIGISMGSIVAWRRSA